MITLSANITEVQSHNQMTVVKVKLLDGTLISTVILETPESLSYLKIGNQVKILFKETEVVLSKEKIENSTLTNELNGILITVNSGDLLARVEIELNFGLVSSIIIKQAFEKLNVRVGDKIFAYINSSEIMLTE